QSLAFTAPHLLVGLALKGTVGSVKDDPTGGVTVIRKFWIAWPPLPAGFSQVRIALPVPGMPNGFRGGLGTVEMVTLGDRLFRTFGNAAGSVVDVATVAVLVTTKLPVAIGSGELCPRPALACAWMTTVTVAPASTSPISVPVPKSPGLVQVTVPVTRHRSSILK